MQLTGKVIEVSRNRQQQRIVTVRIREAAPSSVNNAISLQDSLLELDDEVTLELRLNNDAVHTSPLAAS